MPPALPESFDSRFAQRHADHFHSFADSIRQRLMDSQPDARASQTWNNDLIGRMNAIHASSLERAAHRGATTSSLPTRQSSSRRSAHGARTTRVDDQLEAHGSDVIFLPLWKKCEEHGEVRTRRLSRIHAVETNPHPDPLPFLKGRGEPLAACPGHRKGGPRRL